MDKFSFFITPEEATSFGAYLISEERAKRFEGQREELKREVWHADFENWKVEQEKKEPKIVN